MDFSIEPKEALIDAVHVRVYSDEYRDDYLKQLKQAARNVSLPGFRPGMVPQGLVKKRFGPSFLADQLNKLVGKGLSEFIEEQGIRFVGRPFLVSAPFSNLDPEGTQDLEFVFEIGREPEFELNLDALQPVYRYHVQVSDADVDKAVHRYRYQYGASNPAEVVDYAEGRDYNVVGILYLAETQPEDAPALPFPRLLYVHTALVPELRPLVEGKRPGEAVEFEMPRYLKDDMAAAALLRLDPETYVLAKPKTLRYEIRQLVHSEPAVLDAEFYGKVLQNVAVPPADEAAFRDALKAKLQADAQTMAEMHVNDMIKRDLLAAHPFELPDRILAQWLYEEFDEFKKEGELQKRYPQYRADLRFHLIQRKLKERYPDLELSEADLRDALSKRFAEYFTPPPAAADAESPETSAEPTDAAAEADSNPALQPEFLNSLVDNFLQDDNMRQREYNFLANKRLFEVLEQRVVPVQAQAIDYDTFEQKVATGAR